MAGETKKEAADALAKLRSRAAPVIERAPLPILEVQGPDHVVSYVNSAFCHWLGKTRGELLGKSFAEIVCGGADCIPILDKVYETGQAATHAREDDSDPNAAYWLYAMWPALDEHQKPAGVIIQLAKTAKSHQTAAQVNEALLISGLRQHELTEAAEKSNEQLKAEIAERKKTAHELSEKARLLDLSNDAIVVRDLEGRILYWNHGAEYLYGWSREEALGKPIHSLLGTEFPKPLKQITEELHQNGRWTGELVQTKRTGERITVLARKALDRDSQGKPSAVLENNTDITERIRAREALLESEKRYRNLFNSMDEGFCIIEMIFDDYEKPVDYRFLEVNPSFEKQSGLTGTMTGKRVREFIPNLEASWFEIYGKVALTGVPIRFAQGSKALDNQWFDVYAFRIGGAESRKVAVLFNNITERKRIEEALHETKEQLDRHAQDLEKQVAERTSKLRDSIKSLESLTYTMAHDLRAPLRAMKSLTTVLMEDVPLNEEGRNYAERINTAAERMDQLVNALLDYGQLTHLEFPVHPVNLKTQIDKTLEEFCEDIMLLGAEIEVREPLPSVKGNETLLHQILSNLLGNAFKFIAPGVTPKILFRAEPRGSMVRLWVEDNGIGIASEYQDQIFGVFQRLHTTAQFPGTGVGLAITRRAAERMGGAVGIESEPGKGSRFWVEFPKA